MESQPQNPEFRSNPENFHSCQLIPDISSSENSVDPDQLASGSTLFSTLLINTLYNN